MKLLSNIILTLGLIIANNEEPKFLKNMTVSAVQPDAIEIKWQDIGASSYRIFRSEKIHSDFEMIAEVKETSYKDTAPRGIKFWYKIEPLWGNEPENTNVEYITEEEYISKQESQCNETANQQSEAGENKKCIAYCGFIIPDKPKSYKVDEITKQKNKNLPKLSREEKLLWDKRDSYLKKYYMNAVKLSLVLTMGKPYVDKGDVLIFSDEYRYELFPEEDIIVFYDKDLTYKVIFNSSKIFEILRESNDSGLEEILLKNPELFCVPSGIDEVIDENGSTKILNVYNAVGFSTRLFKEDKEWKFRTILLATSRKDLKDQLMNATKSKNQEE